MKTVEIRPNINIAYTEHGDPNGYPVLLFHGWPSSLSEFTVLYEKAKDIGLRIFHVYRPGYSESTHIENRTIGQWANQMSLFLEKLNLQKPHILAFSGGAPYAYAVARYFPNEVGKIFIISGLTELALTNKKHWSKQTRLYFGLANKFPWMLETILRFILFLKKTFPNFTNKLISKLMSNELAKSGVNFDKVALNLNFEQNFAHGVRGPVTDASLYVKKWDFEVEDIEKELYIFHGKNDELVKFDAVINHVKRLKYKKEFYSDGNHFEIASRADLVLNELVS